jgi:hypothetical protein
MNTRPTGRKLVELERHPVQPLRGHGEIRERILLFIGCLLASRGQQVVSHVRDQIDCPQVRTSAVP